MNIFNRSITVNITTEDNRVATIYGIFLDTYHEICLTLTANLDTFQILTASGELRRTPDEECLQCESLIPNLAGLQIGPALNKKIKAAVGLEPGCAHLADLAMECVKSFFQAKFTVMQRTQTTEEIESQVGDYLKGSCYHYRNDK
ncbi:MAG: DUF2889 domain-containing protein [Desulfitobacteriaceae bacterium]